MYKKHNIYTLSLIQHPIQQSLKKKNKEKHFHKSHIGIKLQPPFFYSFMSFIVMSITSSAVEQQYVELSEQLDSNQRASGKDSTLEQRFIFVFIVDWLIDDGWSSESLKVEKKTTNTIRSIKLLMIERKWSCLKPIPDLKQQLRFYYYYLYRVHSFSFLLRWLEPCYKLNWAQDK